MPPDFRGIRESTYRVGPLVAHRGFEPLISALSNGELFPRPFNLAPRVPVQGDAATMFEGRNKGRLRVSSVQAAKAAWLQRGGDCFGFNADRRKDGSRNWVWRDD